MIVLKNKYFQIKVTKYKILIKIKYCLYNRIIKIIKIMIVNIQKYLNLKWIVPLNIKCLN